MPKMKHRDGGRQITVAPDMVTNYESQGWRVVTPPAKKSAAKSRKK